MSESHNLYDFLEPINDEVDFHKDDYRDGQFGKLIDFYTEELPDFFEKDIILVGCGETRGTGSRGSDNEAPNAIREEFYKLYCWHPDIKIADAGNIKRGANLNDTYAALRMVIKELTQLGKMVLILGGSRDLTLAQYYNYVANKKVVEAVCVDAFLNLDLESLHRSENYLMELLTGEPNYIRHYNHIGFQSYYVHPRMLETMDKLRFDFYRVGTVKENIEEIEPVFRNSSLFSFDISAIAHAFAPSNHLSPNGFNGEEACTIMRYAGLSPNINTVGIYGYAPEKDFQHLTAKQISQMLWYLVDGKSRGRREASLDEKDSFIEYHTAFAEVETVFLKSRKTSRWWMQLPDKKYIACTYKDYLLASSNEIPERWMRAQERV